MKKQTRSVDEMFIGALKKVFSGPDKVELGVIPAEEIAVSQDIQERFEGMKVEMETKSRKFMDDLKAEYKPLAKQLDDENRVAWSGIAARFGMTFDELTSRNPQIDSETGVISIDAEESEDDDECQCAMCQLKREINNA